MVYALEHGQQNHAGHRENRHDRHNRPALTAVADHDAEGARQREGDTQKQEDLYPIRPRRRVLERVRGVGVEKATAIRAELLDDLLRCDRPSGKGLLATSDGGDGVIVVEVLDHSRRDEHDREYHRYREQDAKADTSQVDPEVADAIGLAPGEPAYQRDRDGHAHRGGGEVLYRQAGHLRDVAESVLSGIALPVGIGNEADRGVPGLATGHLRDRIGVTEIVL